MNLKKLSLIIGLLALVSAVLFFAKRPSTDTAADPRVGASLVPSSLVESAAKFRLSDQGRTVTVVKAADGSWSVASYHDFPADFAKLSSFVDELLKAKVDRFVSARKERIAGFEFKDTRIALLDANDKELWSVTLGKNAEGGGRLLRFSEEQKAYLSRLSLWLDTESKNWADSSLVGLKPEDIAQVELSFPGSDPVLVKRARKEDSFAVEKNPEGRRLKADKISSLLGSLTGLRFTETSALEDPRIAEAAAHERTVKLTSFDGKVLSIALGRKPEQKILKAPDVSKDAKQEGPADALAKIKSQAKKAKDEKPGDPVKALEPLTETIPAGPVFARISHSEPKAPVNALMKKRAFQVFEFAFTAIPEKADDLFEPAPK